MREYTLILCRSIAYQSLSGYHTIIQLILLQIRPFITFARLEAKPLKRDSGGLKSFEEPVINLLKGVTFRNNFDLKK